MIAIDAFANCHDPPRLRGNSEGLIPVFSCYYAPLIKKYSVSGLAPPLLDPVYPTGSL